MNSPYLPSAASPAAAAELRAGDRPQRACAALPPAGQEEGCQALRQGQATLGEQRVPTNRS